MSATAQAAHGRALRADRIICAALVAALHVGALVQLGSAIFAPSRTMSEQPKPQDRALLVTAFISEEQARGAPRFAVLAASDAVQAATAIVLPLPRLPSIRPVATDSFERPSEIASTEDIDKAKRLQGLYVGQIKARLLRLLEDVSDLHAASTATPCVVYVVQNERGHVLDVMSDECAADAEWRRGVESAIRRASPLPRPPEGLSMGSYLTLDLSTLR